MSPTSIAALVGVAGFIMSLGNLLWILYKERRTRKSIRAMICIEIEYNLARLRNFRSEANKAATFSAGHPLSQLQTHDALRLGTLPTFNHSVWRSLTASIPTALRPSEIKDVYDFHRQLDDLTALKEHRDQDSSPSQHAGAIEDAITQLTKTGNPLKCGTES